MEGGYWKLTQNDTQGECLKLSKNLTRIFEWPLTHTIRFQAETKQATYKMMLNHKTKRGSEKTSVRQYAAAKMNSGNKNWKNPLKMTHNNVI